MPARALGETTQRWSSFSVLRRSRCSSSLLSSSAHTPPSWSRRSYVSGDREKCWWAWEKARASGGGVRFKENERGAALDILRGLAVVAGERAVRDTQWRLASGVVLGAWFMVDDKHAPVGLCVLSWVPSELEQSAMREIERDISPDDDRLYSRWHPLCGSVELRSRTTEEDCREHQLSPRSRHEEWQG